MMLLKTHGNIVTTREIIQEKFITITNTEVKMEKAPTAKEFFDSDNGLYAQYSVKDRNGNFIPVCSYEKAVEFAKLHVKAALDAAAENATTKVNNESTSIIVDKDSIRNAYPDELIK